MSIRYRTIVERDGTKSRHRVVMHRGWEGYVIRWTGTCSGCHESEDGHSIGDYEYDAKNQCELGMGCQECGYTGKTRREEWIAFDMGAYMEWDEKRWRRRERLLAYWHTRRVA